MKTIEQLHKELDLINEIYDYYAEKLFEEYSEEVQEKIHIAIQYKSTIEDQIVQAFCNTIKDEEYIEI